MRIVRYRAGHTARYGIVIDGKVHALRGNHPYGRRPIAGAEVGSLEQVSLLAPCEPSKIVAIGRNYAAHAREHGEEVPSEPLIFLKAPSAVIGPGAPIVLTPQSRQVEHESELCIVIGRRAASVSRAQALDYVFGYTCGNDVTARDLQRTDGQWSRSKGFDTFCPLGPWIENELDASNLAVSCRVNGETRQSGRTADLVFDVPFLVSYISHIMTLMPGDVIMSGTPAGVSPIVAGDRVEVEVEGIGVLSNPVVSPK